MFNNSAIKKASRYCKEVEFFIKKNPLPEIIGIPNLSNLFSKNPCPENKKKNNFYKKSIKFFKFFFLKRFFFSNINSKQEFSYLIVSHFINYENIGYTKDFYFGNLAEKLGKKKVLFLLIDHIGLNRNKLNKKISGNYVILPKFLSLFEEIKLYFVTFFVLFYKGLFFQKIKILTLSNVAGSVENQRIGMQVNFFAKKFKIKKILMTYEGQPYEKLICGKEKEDINTLNPECIGYQFGVLRKFQHSIFMNIGKKYLPHKILTINNYNKKILDQNFKNKLKVFNVGLIKQGKDRPYKKKNFKKIKKINILVMPEGILSEVMFFLKYCLNNQDKRINFNLRLHPIFQNNNFIKTLNLNNSMNIKLSKNKLNEDLSENNYILYRGTAAVISAVKKGLVPIYLKNNSEVTNDALYNFNKLHLVNFDEDLLKFIIKIKKKAIYKKEREKIYNFSKSFYDKPNFSNILSIIK